VQGNVGARRPCSTCAHTVLLPQLQPLGQPMLPASPQADACARQCARHPLHQSNHIVFFITILLAILGGSAATSTASCCISICPGLLRLQPLLHHQQQLLRSQHAPHMGQQPQPQCCYAATTAPLPDLLLLPLLPPCPSSTTPALKQAVVRS
jgi:hypothetical protein